MEVTFTAKDLLKEIEFELLKNLNNIEFTSKSEKLSAADVFIVTVPTPIDKFKKPDFSALINASKMIGEIIKSRINKKFPIIL